MSLATYYELMDALEKVNVRNADIRVTIIDGEVHIEEYKNETCIIA
jgi:hypothetical protein